LAVLASGHFANARSLSALGLDADALFDAKMAHNWQRPYKYNTARGG